MTQASITQEVNEAMRGGFTVHVTYVRENRAYLTRKQVDVPWTNKDLSVKWEHFTSKLEPGVKETWTAVITGSDAKKAVAEMVAALYDESLDAYKPHNWQQNFTNLFRRDRSNLSLRFENSSLNFRHLHGGWKRKYENVNWSHRGWRPDMIGALWGYRGGRQMLYKSSNSAGVAFNRAPGAPGEPMMEMAMDSAAAPAPHDGHGQTG